MNIDIPELSVVVLIGTSGSGKSSFARKHFRATEILSSDWCRGLVSDDENDQAATPAAFEVLNFIAAKRLAAGKLVVIDATNVQKEARKPLVELARRYHCLPVAIVLDLPESVCHQRNAGRPDRDFGPHVVRNQAAALNKSLRHLRDEGFRHVYRLRSVEEVDAACIRRQPLWNNKKNEHGPFDIVGDIHGCHDELVALLGRLGYVFSGEGNEQTASHPAGRKAVFVGDLVDRGPASNRVLRLVMNMVRGGHVWCVPGNHEDKLKRHLSGKAVKLTHGLAQTIEQLAQEPETFRREVAEFIDGLISHYVFDDGKLVVAHAGLREEMHGRGSGAVRSFALYGDTTGETDEFGLPVRYDWAAEYRGRTMVVYGHTPVPEAVWLNNTICIDTGCVFGGSLTALRYPERELVSEPARRVYYEPVRPLQAEKSAAPARDPGLLDISDVTGKRIVQTRIQHSVTVREENSAAALEVMSRFAVDPEWLVYLPPTMSPSESCPAGEWLERPEQAFAFFQREGIAQVVCEEKHMGSRAVVVVCRDAEVGRRRFGARDNRGGVIYTRTGRAFFSKPETEEALLARLRAALDRAGWWERFSTDWFVLDAELLPWSEKAVELLRSQYAATASAALTSIPAVIGALQQAVARGVVGQDVLQRYEQREAMAQGFRDAYRRYCWPVERLDDYKLAPFHLLASEGAVHVEKDHVWHMETLAELCAVDPGIFRPTQWRLVDLADEASVTAATSWWEGLTQAGGEGMVVKSRSWLSRGKRGLVQPALKCRGREYLRLIYGPEYTAPENIDRLRARNLSGKRSLAIREYALGLEALYRFVDKQPLYAVHECVFAVLAMESEPVDPRL